MPLSSGYIHAKGLPKCCNRCRQTGAPKDILLVSNFFTQSLACALDEKLCNRTKEKTWNGICPGQGQGRNLYGLFHIIESISRDSKILQDIFFTSEHIGKFPTVMGKGNCFFHPGEIKYANDFLPASITAHS